MIVHFEGVGEDEEERSEARVRPEGPAPRMAILKGAIAGI